MGCNKSVCTAAIKDPHTMWPHLHYTDIQLSDRPTRTHTLSELRSCVKVEVAVLVPEAPNGVCYRDDKREVSRLTDTDYVCLSLPRI